MQITRKILIQILCIVAISFYVQDAFAYTQVDDVASEQQVEVTQATAKAKVAIENANEAIERAREQVLDGTITAQAAGKIIIEQTVLIAQVKQELKSVISQAVEKVAVSDEEISYLDYFVSGAKGIGAQIIAPFKAGYGYTELEKKIARKTIKGLMEQQEQLTMDYEQAISEKLTGNERLNLKNRYEAIITQLNNEIYKQKVITGEEMSPERKLFWAAVGSGALLVGGALLTSLAKVPEIPQEVISQPKSEEKLVEEQLPVQPVATPTEPVEKSVEPEKLPEPQTEQVVPEPTKIETVELEEWEIPVETQSVESEATTEPTKPEEESEEISTEPVARSDEQKSSQDYNFIQELFRAVAEGRIKEPIDYIEDRLAQGEDPHKLYRSLVSGEERLPQQAVREETEELVPTPPVEPIQEPIESEQLSEIPNVPSETSATVVETMTLQQQANAIGEENATKFIELLNKIAQAQKELDEYEGDDPEKLKILEDNLQSVQQAGKDFSQQAIQQKQDFERMVAEEQQQKQQELPQTGVEMTAEKEEEKELDESVVAMETAYDEEQKKNTKLINDSNALVASFKDELAKTIEAKRNAGDEEGLKSLQDRYKLYDAYFVNSELQEGKTPQEIYDNLAKREAVLKEDMEAERKRIQSKVQEKEQLQKKQSEAEKALFKETSQLLQSLKKSIY